MTILLIDDSASVREVLCASLEAEGYRVLEAADGREGMLLYREHRPALVIADIVMPEKERIETVREILVIHPAAVMFTRSGLDTDGDYQETARMLEARRARRTRGAMKQALSADSCMRFDSRSHQQRTQRRCS